MSEVDLHLHSSASDGRYPPSELVARAAEKGLTIIALADHDTVDGIVPALEAARAFPGLRVIPCVEMSSDIPHGEVHILGYFIDYTDAGLLATLERMRSSRVVRAEKMVTRLRGLGLYIDWKRVQEIAGSSVVGRPHIAQALLEKGYISSVREAFTKYISRDGPAYVEREKITPEGVVALIVQAGGLPVLAHPHTVGDLEQTVIKLAAAGMVGLETYYAGYNPEQVKELVRLAEKNGLITTGGSDFHGLEPTEAPLGEVDVPMKAAEQLLTLAAQRQGRAR